jgi:putative ABC transport system ATP-binding protein
VRVVNLYRSYQRGKVRVPALNGVSLNIARGEIAGIVGPSGSGKSTLLHLIAGLDTPTSGKAFLDGTDLSMLKQKQLADYRLKKVGFIFQFYNLIPTLSALENVEVPLWLAGVGKNEREERAFDLLSTVGLDDRVEHFPDEMSGGEAQRVAIARALANEPAVVLGDEPTGDLDSKSAIDFLELVKSLNKENGQTFVLVTHDPLVVKECTKAYAIRDGKIEREIMGAEINEDSAGHGLNMERLAS